MTRLKKGSILILMCLFMILMMTAVLVPAVNPESSMVYASESKSKKKHKKTVKNGFREENDNWYYYKDGKKQTGWFKVKNKKFYGRKTGDKGRLLQGWWELNGETYFFRQNGKKGVICSLAVDGVAKANGIKCVFDKKGQLVKCANAETTKASTRNERFIRKVGELARKTQARENILASLIVAQACLETGFGAHVYGNNLFGIREGSPTYHTYDSWEDSIAGYVKFMHTYIPSIFGVRNSITATSIIGRSGYAQASGYGSSLLSIIIKYDLRRFNK